MANDPGIRVVVSKNGPYVVYGKVPLLRLTIGIDAEGVSEQWLARATLPTEAEHYALCRCGQSENKPFCDGSHVAINFRE